MTRIRFVQTLRRRWRLVLIAGFFFLLLAVVGINVVAYRQAWAMTHYSTFAGRTPPPEVLSRWGKFKILLMGVNVPRPENRATPADVGLEYKTVRFGGANNDDCEAWFVPSSGKGLCITFHAYSSSKSSQIQAARAFHDLGYDVLMVDFRGSGGSKGDVTSHGYFEAEDVVAAVKYSKEHLVGINPSFPSELLVLYGESMGGTAVLRAVGELNVRPDAIIVESVYDRYLSIMQNRFSAMRVPSFPLANLLVFWEGEQIGFSGFKLNPADYATHIQCPVLLMQGNRDPRVSDSQARNLFNHLAGLKHFEIFENAGHCDFLRLSPDRWRNVVSTFLFPIGPATSMSEH